MTLPEAAKRSQWIRRKEKKWMLIKDQGRLGSFGDAWAWLTKSDVIADDWEPYIPSDEKDAPEIDPEDDSSTRFKMMELD